MAGSNCPGPRISRRRMLQVGGASMLGLSLPQLLCARDSAASASADACIIIFLNGGPSHLDMWDMKPDAPAEIRGEFKPIATSVPGVQFGEHLPRLARLMHRCNRGPLGPSQRQQLRMRPPSTPALPDTIAARLAAARNPPIIRPLAPWLASASARGRRWCRMSRCPTSRQEGAGRSAAAGVLWRLLGRSRDPLFVLRDPNAPNFAMPELTLGRASPP